MDYAKSHYKSKLVSLIISVEPTVSELLNCLTNNCNAEEIRDALKQSQNAIKELFFDSNRVKTLEILHSRLDKKSIEGLDLLSLLGSMDSYYSKKESEFFAEIQKHIDEKMQRSIAYAIKNEWKRLTGTESPESWEKDNKIPARFALGNIAESRDIIDAVKTPGKFAASKLCELHAILRNLIPINVAECQKCFMLETIPKKYSKLGVSLSSLLSSLASDFGSPNNWPPKPDISAFIHREYGLSFAPQVIEKIKKWPVDELKTKLVELAQNNAELGLLLLEDE